MENINKWKNYKELKSELRLELEMMSEEELNDAFYTTLSFGTGGMRGVIGVGTNRMNIYTLRRANYGFGNYLLKKYQEQPAVVIAYDSRHFSREFAQESAAVLASLGLKIYLFQKITPTPVLSFAVRHLKAQGGIVITASHNPPQYNGYKIYDEDGCQLVPDVVDKVIQEIECAPDAFDIAVKPYEELKQAGAIVDVPAELDDVYLGLVKGLSVHPELDKHNFRIVFSPLHGTSAYLGEKLLRETGYQYLTVKEQMIPDPNFSTVVLPNPEDPKAFTLAIRDAKEVKADLCVATDPDADRVGIAVLHNNEYHLLNGNQTGALLIYYLAHEKKINAPAVIFNTIVSSDLGAQIARSKGLEVKSTLTGFKYIGEQAKLLESTNKKFFFGYEESFGYVIGDFVRDKDSLQALLLCCEMANFYKLQGLTLLDVLEKIYQEYGYYQETLLNVNLAGQAGALRIGRIMEHFRKLNALEGVNIIKKEDYSNGIKGLPAADVLKFYLDDGSWFVLRPSGTEPKLKVYVAVVAGSTEKASERVTEIKNNIQNMIEKVG